MSDLTIQTIMQNTPKVFNAQAAAGLDAVIQMNFTGEEASQWYMIIRDQTCQVDQGQAQDPHMTMTVDSEDYKAIIGGELNAMNAFMQGKIKVSGDMSLAMKMQSLFSR